MYIPHPLPPAHPQITQSRTGAPVRTMSDSQHDANIDTAQTETDFLLLYTHTFFSIYMCPNNTHTSITCLYIHIILYII